MSSQLSPELLLHAYSIGVFPMAESADDTEVFWVDPKRRGILPLDGFHISRSLKKRIRTCGYDISFNRDFSGVVHGCADRKETWINQEIHDAYCQLHDMGHAHSIEVWDNLELIGGVYGVSIGGAYFGESMFSRRKDGSKIALAYLTHHLAALGYVLIDTQFITDHLASLGGVEISRADYQSRLATAIAIDDIVFADSPVPTIQDVLQRNTHTS